MTMLSKVPSRVFTLAWFWLGLTVVWCGPLSAAEFRVLTYNIHHGRGFDDNVDLQRIAKVIKSAEPDLVALNEVDKGVNRSGNMDEPAELGKLTGMYAAFEKNIDHDGGEYGNAILSRWPIQKTENVRLPSLYQGEQRGMLMVHIEPEDGQPLWFAATHLDYRPDNAERLASAKMIEQLMANRFGRQPVLLAGDFNAQPNSRVIKQFSQNWLVADSEHTFPANKPVRRIDYVMAQPANLWKVKSAKVLDAPVESDHRPVLVVLDLVD